MRLFKILLYLVGIFLLAVFIFVSVKPAVADYYYRQALLPQASNLMPQVELLQKAIQLDSSNALYHYELGKLYAKQPLATLISALTEYQKAVELNPTNGKYRQSLAWVYGQLGEPVESSVIGHQLSGEECTDLAHREFQKAIELEPNNPYRHRAYAAWLFDRPTLKNIERGIAEYRKSIELEPELAEEGLLGYYRYQKDYTGLLDILPVTENNDYFFFRFLIKEKDLKFAADFAERHLKTYLQNEKIHLLIANLSSRDKSFPWEIARKHYNIALENAPASSLYRMMYGIALYRRGESVEALRKLEEAVESGLDPVNLKQARDYIRKIKEEPPGTI